jgi:hypothetical protein
MTTARSTNRKPKTRPQWTAQDALAEHQKGVAERQAMPRKPSPGPWTLGQNYYTRLGYAVCSGHQVIAEVVGFGYPLGKGGHPVSDANARLIAAAPALLDALIECYEVLADGSYHNAPCVEQARQVLLSLGALAGEG